MVDAVEVRDVVQEEAALPAEEVAVDGRGGAPLEVPLAVAVMGELHVGVMEVRDHDEPAGTAVVEHGARENTPTHQWVTSSHGMP